MTSKDPESPEISEMFKGVLEVLQESSHLDEVREPADLDALAREMEKTMQELNHRAEELYQATGMTREELQEFSQHKENFSDDEWKLLTEVREHVDAFQKRTEHIMEQGLLEQLDVPESPPPPKKPRNKPKKKSGTSKRVKRKDWMGG